MQFVPYRMPPICRVVHFCTVPALFWPCYCSTFAPRASITSAAACYWVHCSVPSSRITRETLWDGVTGYGHSTSTQNACHKWPTLWSPYWRHI